MDEDDGLGAAPLHQGEHAQVLVLEVRGIQQWFGKKELVLLLVRSCLVVLPAAKLLNIYLCCSLYFFVNDG